MELNVKKNKIQKLVAKASFVICVFCYGFLCVELAFARTVESEGFSVISNDLSATRQAALDDAKRVAVEQLFGSFIKARSQTDNFLLAEDKVYSTVSGKLDTFEILEQGKMDATTYRVKIQATVDPFAKSKEIAKVLLSNKLLKKPRIAMEVVVAEGKYATNVSQTISQRVAERLTFSGFTVIDDAMEKGLPTSFGLKLYVSTSIDKNAFQGLAVTTNQVAVSAKLYASGVKNLVSQGDFNDKKAGANSLGNLQSIASKLGRRVAQKVEIDTIDTWLNTVEMPVLLRIESSSAENTDRTVHFLENNVAGLSQLTLEDKSNHNQTMSLVYVGWPEQLYEQLDSIETKPFSISHYSGSSLTLDAN